MTSATRRFALAGFCATCDRLSSECGLAKPRPLVGLANVPPSSGGRIETESVSGGDERARRTSPRARGRTPRQATRRGRLLQHLVGQLSATELLGVNVRPSQQRCKTSSGREEATGTGGRGNTNERCRRKRPPKYTTARPQRPGTSNRATVLQRTARSQRPKVNQLFRPSNVSPLSCGRIRKPDCHQWRREVGGIRSR